MGVYPLFLADAAYLYFTLLNETLAEGGDFRDGKMTLQKAKGRQFDGGQLETHEQVLNKF